MLIQKKRIWAKQVKRYYVKGHGYILNKYTNHIGDTFEFDYIEENLLYRPRQYYTIVVDSLYETGTECFCLHSFVNECH